MTIAFAILMDDNRTAFRRHVNIGKAYFYVSRSALDGQVCLSIC